MFASKVRENSTSNFIYLQIIFHVMPFQLTTFLAPMVWVQKYNLLRFFRLVQKKIEFWQAAVMFSFQHTIFEEVLKCHLTWGFRIWEILVLIPQINQIFINICRDLKVELAILQKNLWRFFYVKIFVTRLKKFFRRETFDTKTSKSILDLMVRTYLGKRWKPWTEYGMHNTLPPLAISVKSLM